MLELSTHKAASVVISLDRYPSAANPLPTAPFGVTKFTFLDTEGNEVMTVSVFGEHVDTFGKIQAIPITVKSGAVAAMQDAIERAEAV